MTPHAPATVLTARSWAMLILLGAVWGGSFFFARIAVADIEPLTLVLLRVALAAATLWSWLAVTRADIRPMVAHAGPLLFLALVNNVIPFSLIFAGQTAIGAGLASIMNGLTPFWTALIAWAWGVEARPSLAKTVGIAIGFSGAALMVFPGLNGAIGGPAWAKLAVMGAGIAYGVAASFARRFHAVPPTLVAAGQLTGSTMLMLPFAALFGNPSSALAASPTVWAAVLALAVVSTAFAYILYFHLIATAGATNASLVTFIVPASALLLGVAFLGETLAPYEIAGMAVIVLGLAVIDGRLFSRR